MNIRQIAAFLKENFDGDQEVGMVLIDPYNIRNKEKRRLIVNMRAVCPACLQDIDVIGGFILKYETHNHIFTNKLCEESGKKIAAGSIIEE